LKLLVCVTFTSVMAVGITGYCATVAIGRNTALASACTGC